VWCGGSRSRAVAGSSGRRRRCGAASSVLALPKIEPARTRAQRRVRAARAAAKSAGAAADAGSSEPQPWGSARGDGGASGAGFGPAAGAHLVERPRIDPRVETAPATREEGGVRWLEIVEPASADRGSPGWRQAGHGFARAGGRPVLALWVAALGRQGPKGGRRACTSADIAAKRPFWTGDPARTWDRAWHTSDINFRARNGHKGAQTGGHAPHGVRRVGRSKSIEAQTYWSAGTASSAFMPVVSSDLAGRDGRPKILQPGTEKLIGTGRGGGSGKG